MIDNARKIVTENHEQLKHVVDAVAIPSGIIAGITQYVGLINGFLTITVLLLNAVWAAYRIVDMRNHQRRNKR